MVIYAQVLLNIEKIFRNNYINTYKATLIKNNTTQ